MHHRFKVTSIDLLGPLIQGIGGYHIMEDCASRWVELLLLREAAAETCTEALLDDVLLRYGTCRRIISRKMARNLSRQQLAFVMGFKDLYRFITRGEHGWTQESGYEDTARHPGRGQSPRLAQQNPQYQVYYEYSQVLQHQANSSYLTFGKKIHTSDDAHHDLRAIV